MSRSGFAALPWLLFRDPNGTGWLEFAPVSVLSAARVADVPAVLVEAARAAAAGRWAAGFVAYEAAPAFDPAMRTAGAPDGPLAWFAIADAPRRLPRPPRATPSPALEWRPDMTPGQFICAVNAIRRQIAAGDVYQINLTGRLTAAFRGAPERLLAAMLSAQPSARGVLIVTTDWAVVSASPELFFELDGTRITSRPMKGTAARGPDPFADRAAATALAASSKERAENVMILDMVRNDLSRIARPGTVRVDAMWTVERHPTVWQMTSTASAATDAGLPEIFRALFPPASITGAPKIEAMRTIARLETSPRGIYTGAIGFMAPGRRAVFNVGIRTAWVDRRRHVAVYGAGAGIVWDSDPRGEWEETLSKARILAPLPRRFRLLETLAWRPRDGFRLLERHLQRMAASADLFDFRFDPAAARRALRRAAAGWGAAPRRVRLLADRRGALEIDSRPIRDCRRCWTVALAPWPIDPEDPFLRNKTTRREVYERARAACPGVDDVILWNHRGELTESTVANLVLVFGRDRLTPPVSSGLLAGTLRGRLIETGRLREAVLRPADLDRAGAIWLINSVRGWIRARLCPSPAPNACSGGRRHTHSALLRR